MSKITRITKATQQNLEILAKLMVTSKQTIIERVVDKYTPEQFLKKTNEEYAKLKADPQQWAQECKNKMSGTTLSDCLEDE